MKHKRRVLGREEVREICEPFEKPTVMDVLCHYVTTQVSAAKRGRSRPAIVVSAKTPEDITP